MESKLLVKLDRTTLSAEASILHVFLIHFQEIHCYFTVFSIVFNGLESRKPGCLL